jgi:dihydroorotate dehydrogenase
MNPIRRMFVSANALAYRAVRPIIFRQSAQAAHDQLINLLERADNSDFLCGAATGLHQLSFPNNPIQVGGVLLNHPFILAAGFVKGHGFTTEADAINAVATGENIIPGWKSVPKLVGIVEFGSFTRQPRMGNSGDVIWRDAKTQSTQNRVGLKNPGVIAAAEFLEERVIDLPQQFGINIAVSPGVEGEQALLNVSESISAFLKRGIVPNWFTLNVSCPNTEDDPTGNQTASRTRELCVAALAQIQHEGYDTPLWVKISPDLAEMQYKILMRVFAEIGVKAVIATNTLGKPAPGQPTLQAGMGGGSLYNYALHAATICQQEKVYCNYPVDVIGCGGIMDGDSYLRYKARGIQVVQYWSALVYRGPLAAAIIESELS